MDAPENAWLAEYRRGNVEALGHLVEHFRRPLFGFILRMTEGRGDAEEIFQETWLRAIRSLDSYREKRFLSWMFRIAHNLVIDRARRAKPTVDPADGADPAEDRIPAPGAGPAAEAASRDLGARITRAVGRLPVEQKEVFLMRTEGDVPFKEIARIQGVPINTALARMQYALAKLRDVLKEDYKDIAGERP